MKLTSFRSIAHARPGELTGAATCYSRAQGLDLFRQVGTMTRSDTVDKCLAMVSSDHGQTWTVVENIQTKIAQPNGTLRRHVRGGFVDPRTDRLLCFRTEGVLPTDNPLEGMKHWTIRYRVSHDGGRTFVSDNQVIQRGEEYSPEHPVRDVHVGKNAMMIGDFSSAPIIDPSRGHLLHPCQISPPGPDGNYHNPGGGYTWHEAAVLVGTWRDDKTLDWELGERVRIDPKRSTRGLIEPTIAFLPGDRLLMVMRGSNDAKGAMPGYKWFSISRDGGFTWSPVQPWTYSDHSNFFSPSSCSMLLPHSSGNLYWIGNLTPTNPHANLPRRPLVIGRVDPDTGLLLRESVFTVDDRKPGENDKLWFSNFCAYEDRATKEVVINMARTYERGPANWTSDAYEYRLAAD